VFARVRLAAAGRLLMRHCRRLGRRRLLRAV